MSATTANTAWQTRTDTARPRGPLKWVLVAPALYLLWSGRAAIWALWLGVLLVPALWKGPWRWRWRAVILTPLAVVLGGFLSGVLGYVTGTGHLMGMGLPGEEYFNLDRVTRAPKWNGGCCVFGPEFLTQLPNNLALEWMGDVFGPMPGTYRGPYPTRSEVVALLEREGRPVKVSGLERWDGNSKPELEIAEPHVKLSWMDTVRLTWRLYSNPTATRIAVVGDQLAVLEVDSKDGGRRVALISLDGHGVIATYAIH